VCIQAVHMSDTGKLWISRLMVHVHFLSFLFVRCVFLQRRSASALCASGKLLFETYSYSKILILPPSHAQARRAGGRGTPFGTIISSILLMRHVRSYGANLPVEDTVFMCNVKKQGSVTDVTYRLA
jgi:hypothetical protein